MVPDLLLAVVPGVKHHPKDGAKRLHGTRKPLRRSPGRPEQAASRMAAGTRIAQEANAPDNAGDRLT